MKKPNRLSWFKPSKSNPKHHTETMASQLVALILGVGPRIGSSVAEKFASDGYKVAVASRKGTNSINEKGHLSLQADFADPKSVPAVFKAVQSEFHAAPSVVIYNAASLTPPSDPKSLLSIPADRVASDLSINTVSAYAAAQEAVAGWSTLPNDTKKTFIYTGNIMNLVMLPVPMFLNLGVGKAASSYWISQADGAYSEHGYRYVLLLFRSPGVRSLTLTGSSMLMSVRRMVRILVKSLVALRMPSFLHSWRNMKGTCRG